MQATAAMFQEAVLSPLGAVLCLLTALLTYILYRYRVESSCILILIPKFSSSLYILSGVGSTGAPGAGAPPLFNHARADYIQ